MKEEILSVKKLSVSYVNKPTVVDISLKLRRGEIMAIVGESGSGKSTLLKAVLGVAGSGARIDGGKIFFKGQDITDWQESRRRKLDGKSMAMIFQNAIASFCPVRTVGEQIYESVREYEDWSKETFEIRAAAIMEQIHLPESVLYEYPFRLSGGMGQRVGILAAVILEPELILADEPTSALDTVTQAKVADELLALRARRDISLVLVTHNIGLARYMADNIIIMRDGRAVEIGSKEQIFNAPKEAYTRELISAAPNLRETKEP